MNFVDVQPKSFLDYAWTSPSPAPLSTVKSSKTSRKQNRCCDQCRKGKRACDAAILEDTLLDNTGASGSNPTVFHYSDVFGPLAACSNCEKTKKQCTFEWLRSQRVSQATPQPSTAPPTKRRRKSSSSSPQNGVDASQQLKVGTAPQVTTVSDPSTRKGGAPVLRNEPADFAVTFADFPGGIPAFDIDLSSSLTFDSNLVPGGDLNDERQNGYNYLSDVIEDEDEVLFDNDSGKGSSLETLSEGRYESPQDDSPGYSNNGFKTKKDNPQTNAVAIPGTRKKRRRSSSHTPCAWRAPHPSLSPTNNLLSSTNTNILTDGLLKIYHDSFENALSCWLTERTCPYSKDAEVSLANDLGPDWNRIYHRVFRLDRLAAPIRGRNLTFGENKAASRALNLAIFSFATQWAQSGDRCNSKYPFHSDRSDERRGVFAGNNEASFAYKDFDRTLQVSAWHEARMALQSASEIESFRVVLAQIVFSLTQKPTEPASDSPSGGDFGSNKTTSEASDASSITVVEELPSPSVPFTEDNGVDDCDDLLSRLSLTMDSDGPPVHLEQGLRLIHSLRSRVAMSGVLNKTTRRARNSNFPPNRLEAGDQATVDLLFWLGVMFDTLSSAMHKRPLVVSDEDSDIYANGPRPATSSDDDTAASLHRSDSTSSDSSESEGLWDDYLFARQSKRIKNNPVRWPCSYDQASSLLCDAAPVKVLLYRKVTRIQTLLARNVRGERIEMAVKAALEVYEHWERVYAPFISNCIENHDRLPSRIQSWYFCLAGHWHLATLLLADLIEIIDNSELGIESQRQERALVNFLPIFREHNCRNLSDLAACACPRDDASFSKSGDFHFAVNQGALLTEPWTAVLIRAFATAGVILLDSETSAKNTITDLAHQEDAFRRADDCVKALWYLGRKSDMALSAARILGDALKQRRKGAEEKINDMSSFLEAELWEGFEEMSGAFGVECAS